MPRKSRIVLPGEPHHITQRGVRRQDVFFSDDDRMKYKSLLLEKSARYGVEVLAYTLMSNHVHLLLVPREDTSLRWTMQHTHRMYAAYVNGRNGWSGHLWQQKFYSSPVDSSYFWTTLRYIERNPVRAGLTDQPTAYPWSSALFHCGVGPDELITKSQKWRAIKAEVKEWRGFLGEEDDYERVGNLRMNTARDLPTGSAKFLDRIEQQLGVAARPKPLGRPRREVKVG